MLLADRLDIPEGTAALLFDLDGVLLDSLSLDYEIVGKLLREELSSDVEVPRSVIRENFPHAIPDFWRKIFRRVRTWAHSGSHLTACREA